MALDEVEQAIPIRFIWKSISNLIGWHERHCCSFSGSSYGCRNFYLFITFQSDISSWTRISKTLMAHHLIDRSINETCKPSTLRSLAHFRQCLLSKKTSTASHWSVIYSFNDDNEETKTCPLFYRENFSQTFNDIYIRLQSMSLRRIPRNCWLYIFFMLAFIV